MHRTISLLLLGLLSGCGSLDRAASVATGFVSHQLCSATFVSQVEPEQFYREAIAPSLAPDGGNTVATEEMPRQRHSRQKCLRAPGAPWSAFLDDGERWVFLGRAQFRPWRHSVMGGGSTCRCVNREELHLEYR